MIGAGWARVPMIVLATCATVIASQALISGAFSLTRQAIQLGYLPRLEIRHTSGEHEGQIYVPAINGLLLVACTALVVGFGSSTRMAAAYGIAVTGTMAITTVLFFVFARRSWGTFWAGLVCALLLVVDLAFLGSNVTKIESGGWIPLVVAAAVLFVMTTWKLGRDRVARFLRHRSTSLPSFLADLDAHPPVRVPGTAVLMSSERGGAPPVLLHHLKHNQVLHEQVVLLTILTSNEPAVPPEQRLELLQLTAGFWRLIAHYGFMETPNVPEIMRAAAEQGLATHRRRTSYFLGRETFVATGRSNLPAWRRVLFIFLARNARSPTEFFGIPPNEVVELGAQIEV
jgi:KUP system potassium uptake protein